MSKRKEPTFGCRLFSFRTSRLLGSSTFPHALRDPMYRLGQWCLQWLLPQWLLPSPTAASTASAAHIFVLDRENEKNVASSFGKIDVHRIPSRLYAVPKPNRRQPEREGYKCDSESPVSSLHIFTALSIPHLKVRVGMVTPWLLQQQNCLNHRSEPTSSSKTSGYGRVGSFRVGRRWCSRVFGRSRGPGS